MHFFFFFGGGRRATILIVICWVTECKKNAKLSRFLHLMILKTCGLGFRCLTFHV